MTLISGGSLQNFTHSAHHTNWNWQQKGNNYEPICLPLFLLLFFVVNFPIRMERRHTKKKNQNPPNVNKLITKKINVQIFSERWKLKKITRRAITDRLDINSMNEVDSIESERSQNPGGMEKQREKLLFCEQTREKYLHSYTYDWVRGWSVLCLKSDSRYFFSLLFL